MSTTNYDHPIRVDGAFTMGVARCRLDTSNLTAEALTQTLVFNTLALANRGTPIPANARIITAWVNVLVPFAGGGATAATVTLGDAGAPTELLTAANIFTGGAGLKPKSGALASGAFEAAYAPQLVITTVDANVDALTAGVLEAFIQYEQLNTDSLTS